MDGQDPGGRTCCTPSPPRDSLRRLQAGVGWLHLHSRRLRNRDALLLQQAATAALPYEKVNPFA